MKALESTPELEDADAIRKQMKIFMVTFLITINLRFAGWIGVQIYWIYRNYIAG